MFTKRSGLRLLALASTLALASCGGTTKFGGSTVHLTIAPDPASAAMTQLLAIAVSGADTTSLTLPASSAYNSGQPQSFDYHVTAGSGTVMFTISATAYGNTLAQGSGSIAVAAKSTVALQVTLAGTSDGGDGGVPDSGAPDLGPPADLQGSFDLSGVDLGHGPIVPGNGGVAYDPNAGDLSGVTAIDTSGLKLTIADGIGNDGGVTGTPSGVAFVASADGKYAVLTVGKWTVDKEVRVTGTRPLIVVARQVEIADYIHLEAIGQTAGSGGNGPGSGPGAGLSGMTASFPQPLVTGSGGSGAGHGTPGGLGGNSINTGPTPPGNAYGTAVTDLFGGSGGGAGGASQQGACGPGGAGGGAIEIDANESIVVAPGGIINAGGGGPFQIGCSGGGSGGGILFEARAIVVKGILSANGGNAGLPGYPPSDALLGSGVLLNNPGPAAGGTAMVPAGPGVSTGIQGYGGGGAFGRIVLRTSGPYPADTAQASAISPKPVYDLTLP